MYVDLLEIFLDSEMKILWENGFLKVEIVLSKFQAVSGPKSKTYLSKNGCYYKW